MRFLHILTLLGCINIILSFHISKIHWIQSNNKNFIVWGSNSASNDDFDNNSKNASYEGMNIIYNDDKVDTDTFTTNNIVNLDEEDDVKEKEKESSPSSSPLSSSNTNNIDNEEELVRYKMRSRLLENELERQRIEIKKIESNYNSLEERLVNTEDEKTILQKELIISNDNNINNENNMNNQIEIMQKQYNNLKLSFDDLQSDLIQAQSSEKTALSAASVANSRINSMQLRLERVEKDELEAEKYKDRSILLENYMKRSKERASNLQLQLQNSTKQLNDITIDSINVRNENSQLVRAQDMKESEIALLKQTITSKIIENNTLKEELVKLQRQIEVLEEQLQEQITLRISLENNIQNRSSSSSSEIEAMQLLSLELIETKKLFEEQRLKTDKELNKEQQQQEQDRQDRVRDNANTNANANANVRGAVDYLIAGDLSYQRRLMEQQVVLLEALVAALNDVGIVQADSIIDTSSSSGSRNNNGGNISFTASFRRPTRGVSRFFGGVRRRFFNMRRSIGRRGDTTGSTPPISSTMSQSINDISASPLTLGYASSDNAINISNITTESK